MRWPETNSARSHQCDADVGERTRGAAEPLVDAPVVVVRAQQPVLQVGAVDQAHRPGLPAARRARAPRAPSGSSGRRTAPRLTRPTPAAASASCCAPGGVERQRLLADHVLAGRQRGLGEREVQVVRRADVDDVDAGLATISSAESNARSAPSAAGAACADSGDEAATPTSAAPARRAERAWTLPMEPVPAIATRRAMPWNLLGGASRRACVPSRGSRCATWPGRTPRAHPTARARTSRRSRRRRGVRARRTGAAG